jgi:hypothetical protein
MSQAARRRAATLAASGAGLALVWPASVGASATKSVTSETCGRPGYSYAGFQSAGIGHGIAATVSALSVPTVRSGHAAAWVGVGGPGAANGRDAWIQVGLASFAGTGIRLYLEITQPGRAPVYRDVAPSVLPRSRHRLVVREVTRKPNWWRASVDGHPVSSPVYLPGSSGRWHPIATAESWDGGVRTCNRFEYRFEGVSVVKARGGPWKPFVRGFRFEDPGYRVVPLRPGTGFLARFAAPTGQTP